MESEYWIIFGILFILLIWSIRKTSNTYLEGFENIDEQEAKTEEDQVNLTKLLGLLLDNQGFANQIIIDHKLVSVRDLVEKNRKKINLNLKPILDNTQYRIANRYLLLNDIYFTSGKTQIEQDETKIITFSRQTEFIKPKELYINKDEEDQELNSFREFYHLNKNMYLDYQWISEKVKNYSDKYGLIMVTKSDENMKEIFGKNYWEGKRVLSKANLRDLPLYTALYNDNTSELLYKLGNDDWYIVSVNKNNNINLLLRIMTDPLNNMKYWMNLNKQDAIHRSSDIDSDEYFFIRTSTEYDLARLYRKIDEMSQNNYFSDNPGYDKLIKLPSDLEPVYTQLQRMTLFKQWIESMSSNPSEQKLLIENIIIDMNQRVINIFDDICSYLIFYQHQDFAELYLDKYIRPNAPINQWWSAVDFESILIKGTQLGQCSLPAKFNIRKIQNSPPIYKFVYNMNLYHTFWQPLEIYINDLEKFISNKFKTKEVAIIAPIARFCIFNNPTLREYLAKYAACNSDSCNTNLSSMKEPERCAALKLKYQELMNNRMKFQCFYRSKSEIGNKITSNVDKDLLNNKNMTEDEKIDQMFGFSNLILLNIIEYSIKLHQCQTERIEIKDCQSLLDTIDVNDQKDDLKLGTLAIDRESDLYSSYDTQLEEYNKILQSQEIKKLEPINYMANLEENKNKKPIDIVTKSADDFYSIVNDLVNLGSYGEKIDHRVEEFDNQLKENMDLNESSFAEYQARLERQIRGVASEQNVDMLIKTKTYFYNLFDILTKDGRIMTSGMFFIIIAFGLYFIDISS
jgi:hypothetical protein